MRFHPRFDPHPLKPIQLGLYDEPAFQTRRFAFRPHHASRFHIDIRLEVFNVLKSFVIYEFPNLDPSKRLRAKLLDDHNPKWLLSERRIPEGRKGAGPMMVWDFGHYQPINLRGGQIDRRVFDAIENGLLDVSFSGKRLKGGFRFERSGSDWYFSKLQDEFAATADPNWDETSALCGMPLTKIH